MILNYFIGFRTHKMTHLKFTMKPHLMLLFTRTWLNILANEESLDLLQIWGNKCQKAQPNQAGNKVCGGGHSSNQENKAEQTTDCWSNLVNFNPSD